MKVLCWDASLWKPHEEYLECFYHKKIFDYACEKVDPRWIILSCIPLSNEIFKPAHRFLYPYLIGMLYIDGVIYCGQWKYGQPVISLIIGPDHSAYFGDCYNMEPFGHGIFIESSYSYVGDFCFGKKYGIGALYDSDSRVIVKYGIWRDDILIYGHIRYNNSSEYIGEFDNALPHGLGYYTFMDDANAHGEYGLYYSGEWDQGNRSGYGKLVWRVRDENNEMALCSYEGMWQNNNRHGIGKVSKSTCEYYIAIWENDVLIDILYKSMK